MIERFDCLTMPPTSIDDWPRLQMVEGWRHGAYRIHRNGDGWAAELQVPNASMIVQCYDLEYAALSLGSHHSTIEDAIAACRIVADAIQKARHGVLP